MPALHGSKIGFAPRVAAFYAAFFVMIGIHMPFFPVWLKAKGLDPAGYRAGAGGADGVANPHDSADHADRRPP